MIVAQPLPATALLTRHAASGAYTDCFCTEIEGCCTHAEFVEAFYTTPLFKLERLILRLALARPSTHAEARQLARGERDQFAAWTVEARAAHQLLLADMGGRTRYWLMTEALEAGARTRTRLFFGSAVLTRRDAQGGRHSPGWGFSVLLGVHRLYSRALLAAARRRLQ
ncbi:MAG: hypothetical protein FJY44_04640 [Betaproteobacteria bacterium]|nr:hypothetical protein [Betaproteobacteria bacterium]